MFGLALNFKWITAAALAVAVMSFAGGWEARDAFCDAAYFKQQNEFAQARIKQLERNIERIEQTAKDDATKHATDAETLERLEGIIRDQTSQIESGICFGAADADRLRGLWK